MFPKFDAFPIGVLLFLSFGAVLADESKSPPQQVSSSVALFASVNGKSITQADFNAGFVEHLRQKFYHGQVPQDQLAAARKEVGDQLIDSILFAEEIERRGIQPDRDDVEKRVNAYDQRYSSNPNWQKNRELMLPGLRAKLSEQSRRTLLERAVRDVPPPTPEDVKAFYLANPQYFTEPEKLRLYTILLAVDPSSPADVWNEARREAQALVARIRGGADFAEQARLFSRDKSAEQGGDMGYLHVGMLPENLHARLDQFKLGVVDDPVDLLQGIGIFRVDERIPPRLMDFERVAERARDLLVRERQNQAWSGFVDKLRKSAVIVINEPPAASASAK